MIRVISRKPNATARSHAKEAFGQQDMCFHPEKEGKVTSNGYVELMETRLDLLEKVIRESNSIIKAPFAVFEGAHV